MPRPITEADKKPLRKMYPGWSFRFYKDDKLGLYCSARGLWGHLHWSYQLDRNNELVFATRETIQKRKKIGRPKPRRKPMIMRDISMFSFDEIEAAMKVMEELG